MQSAHTCVYGHQRACNVISTCNTGTTRIFCNTKVAHTCTHAHVTKYIPCVYSAMDTKYILFCNGHTSSTKCILFCNGHTSRTKCIPRVYSAMYTSHTKYIQFCTGHTSCTKCIQFCNIFTSCTKCILFCNVFTSCTKCIHILAYTSCTKIHTACIFCNTESRSCLSDFRTSASSPWSKLAKNCTQQTNNQHQKSNEKIAYMLYDTVDDVFLFNTHVWVYMHVKCCECAHMLMCKQRVVNLLVQTFAARHFFATR